MRASLLKLLMVFLCGRYGATFPTVGSSFQATKSLGLLARLDENDQYTTNCERPLPKESLSKGPFPCRRDILQGALLVAAASAGIPSLALAASPITAAEADSPQARWQRLLRPKPPKALRPKLDQDFAVLLMRSSYNALDQLDCVPMDQFQRDFFLIRQAEYEPYVNEIGPGIVQQGFLTDPYYFDFISFAQYTTINREIFQDPPSVFVEQIPENVGPEDTQQFKSVVVKRDPAVTNNLLAPTHRRLVATAILDRFEQLFGNSKSAIPHFESGSRPSAQFVADALDQLTKLFLINGFAWEGKVTISKPSSIDRDATGAQFTFTLTAPANLWSGQALQLQSRIPGVAGVGNNEFLLNTFLLTTARELVSRMGYSVTAVSVSYQGATETSSFTLV